MPLSETETVWIEIFTQFSKTQALLKALEFSIEQLPTPSIENLDVALFRQVMLDCFSDNLQYSNYTQQITQLNLSYENTSEVHVYSRCHSSHESNLYEHIENLVSNSNDTTNVEIIQDVWNEIDALRVYLRVHAIEEIERLDEIVSLSEIELHRLREVGDELRRASLLENVSEEQRQQTDQDFIELAHRLDELEALQMQAALEVEEMRIQQRALINQVAEHIARFGTEN